MPRKKILFHVLPSSEPGSTVLTLVLIGVKRGRQRLLKKEKKSQRTSIQWHITYNINDHGEDNRSIIPIALTDHCPSVRVCPRGRLDLDL